MSRKESSIWQSGVYLVSLSPQDAELIVRGPVVTNQGDPPAKAAGR